MLIFLSGQRSLGLLLGLRLELKIGLELNCLSDIGIDPIDLTFPQRVF